MDTISRGEWSRCSGELCDSLIFDGAVRRRSSLAKRAKGEDAEKQALLLSLSFQEEDDETKIEYGSIDQESEAISPPPRRLSLVDSSKIMWNEGIAMVSLAIPVIGTYVLEMLPGIVSIVLVGHVHSPEQKEYLDAAALSVMYINLTALSVGFGLASAMDTLCSQAYGAGKLPQKAKLYFTTGIMVLSMAMVVILVLNLNAAAILQSLGQPTRVSELAGRFVLYLVPGIPFLFLYELLRKVLQAESVALPMVYVAVGANLINALVGYYLVYGLDHNNNNNNNNPDDSQRGWLSRLTGPDGWLGAAIARTAGNVSFPLLLILYLYWSGHGKKYVENDNDNNTGEENDYDENDNINSENSTARNNNRDQRVWKLIKDAWNGVPQFLSLGIPGALQLCFEWWAFECLALLSGLLPSAVLAIGANAILLNISSMLYMLYLGIAIAVNVRIGNALGANQPQRARLAALLAFALATICAGLCATILIVFRTSLPALFTHDPEIGAYCSQLLYIAAVFQLPDALNAAVQGIFRGSGRQNIGAWLNFVAYYIVGLPIGIVLAFLFDLNLKGLWIGPTVGLFVVVVGGGLLITWSDWRQLAKNAIQRLVEADT